MNVLHDVDIYGITGEEFSRGRNNITVVQEMIRAGIRLIQYREKEKHMGQKFEECLTIRRLTREAGVCFIVNDHVDLAMAVSADGVHVGQDDLPVSVIRQLTGGRMIIGLSTHSPAQAMSAMESGVDYIGVGPVFETKTKKDVCDPVGFDYLDYAVRNVPVPFVAIGGIKEHNVAGLVDRGVRCIAMISEIVGVDDIVGKVSAIRAIMKKEN